MIYLVLFLALILRLFNLNQSLWLDEAINVVAAKSYGLKELITQYSLGDYHPPLFHPFLWLWIKIFGSSEIAVRLPSVIFGCLTVWFTYLIAEEIISKRHPEFISGSFVNSPQKSIKMPKQVRHDELKVKNIPLIAAFFMAIAPYNIYFSQEARMYALEGFLGTAAIYFFFRILKKDSFFNWAGYTIFITLAIYIDYFGFFIPLVPLVFLLTKKTKGLKLLKGWLISTFISVILWLPWLPLFLKQFDNAQRTAINIPGWAQVVGSGTLKILALTFVKFSIGRIHFYNKVLYATGVIPVVLFFIYLGTKGLKIIEKNNRRLLLIWFFLPIITSFLISLKLPIYQPFRLLYLLPVFYILLTFGVFSFKKNWQKVLSGSLIGIISLTGLTFYYFNPRFHRENWREAVAQLEKKGDKNDLVIFVSSEPMSPWIYYQKKNLKAVGKGELQKISEVKRVFLFRYLWPVFDPKDSVREKIEENFKLIDVKEFNGVEWWEYQRKIINFQ